MIPKITTLEKIVFDAFKYSVEDFHKGFIEIEEDFRACMYFHLRSLLSKYPEVRILLSHNIETVEKIIKPDITLIQNDFYRIVIELKNMNRTKRGLIDFSIKSAAKDIKKLESYRDSFERGFFIYFAKNRNKVSPRVANWKVGYYRELYHSVEKKAVHYLEFDKDGYRNIRRKFPNIDTEADL